MSYNVNPVEAYKVCCGEGNGNSWYDRYMALAKAISDFSKDPSTKAGAVICDDKQRVVSMGFNGFPRGIDDSQDRLNDRDTKYNLTVHAEINSILFAKQNLDNCTIFVYPMAPCVRCAVVIIQSGIKRVVSHKLPSNLEDRWGDSVKLSGRLFKEAGVELVQL